MAYVPGGLDEGTVASCGGTLGLTLKVAGISPLTRPVYVAVRGGNVPR